MELDAELFTWSEYALSCFYAREILLGATERDRYRVARRARTCYKPSFRWIPYRSDRASYITHHPKSLRPWVSADKRPIERAPFRPERVRSCIRAARQRSEPRRRSMSRRCSSMVQRQDGRSIRQEPRR